MASTRNSFFAAAGMRPSIAKTWQHPDGEGQFRALILLLRRIETQRANRERAHKECAPNPRKKRR
jgi:hypothetical protein